MVREYVSKEMTPLGSKVDGLEKRLDELPAVEEAAGAATNKAMGEFADALQRCFETAT